MKNISELELDWDRWRILNKFKKNVASQYGEDGIIEFLINLFPEVPHTCCEFGGGDGFFVSNTFNLWHNKGWYGLLIESNHKDVEIARKNYGDRENLKIIEKFIAEHGPDSIDDIYQSNGFSPDLGVMSIDIDSHDYYVFKNMNYVRPYIIIIEFNNHIPVDVDYADAPGDVFLRCSAKALQSLGWKKGYRLIACTVTNVFLIREDLIDDRRSTMLPNLPIECLFDYNGQFLNQTYPCFPVHSQMVTHYPVFSKKPPIHYLALRLLMSLFRPIFRFGRPERFKGPSAENRKRLESARLWVL